MTRMIKTNQLQQLSALRTGQRASSRSSAVRGQLMRTKTPICSSTGKSKTKLVLQVDSPGSEHLFPDRIIVISSMCSPP